MLFVTVHAIMFESQMQARAKHFYFFQDMKFIKFQDIFRTPNAPSQEGLAENGF